MKYTSVLLQVIVSHLVKYPVINSSLVWVVERSAAHFDMLYAWVPLVHLLHSDKQEIVELVHAGLQYRLQPEHLPGSGHHFATDHVPVALKRSDKQVYNRDTTVTSIQLIPERGNWRQIDVWRRYEAL